MVVAEAAGTDRPKVAVAVLEDDQWAAVGIRMNLESQEDIRLVVVSDDPASVIAVAKEGSVDVAIVDLKIHGKIEVGIAAIREIRRESSTTRCIVLTAFADLGNFLATYDAGVAAYAKKTATGGRQPALPDLVRLVAAGGRYFDPEIIDEMRPRLIEAHIVEGACPKDCGPLTPREREVLLELGRGHTNAEIADSLVITHNTVKAHVASISSKLGVKGRRQIVLVAMSQGLLPESPDL